MLVIHYILYATMLAYVYNLVGVPKSKISKVVLLGYLLSVVLVFPIGFFFDNFRLSILIYMSIPAIFFVIDSVDRYVRAILGSFTNTKDNNKKDKETIGF